MVKHFGRSNDGFINLEEFNEFWKYQSHCVVWFQKNQVDEKMHLHVLISFLQKEGYILSPQLIQSIFKKCDYNKQGFLWFDGFLDCMLFIQTWTEEFQRRDINRNGNANFTYEQYLTSL